MSGYQFFVHNKNMVLPTCSLDKEKGSKPCPKEKACYRVRGVPTRIGGMVFRCSENDLDSEITSLIKGVLSLYLRISTHTSKEHTCTHLRFRSSYVHRTQTCGEVGMSENRRWENLPPKLPMFRSSHQQKYLDLKLPIEGYYPPDYQEPNYVFTRTKI